MAKIIKYQFLSHEINHGTEENPDIEQVFQPKEVRCRTEEGFQAVLPLVKQEAFNGEYTVEDDGQPEPVVPVEVSVWDELDAAYQRGVDSV